MHTIIKYFFLPIFSMYVLGCTNEKVLSLKEEAFEASNIYCDCVRENVFKFEYTEELYVFCNKRVMSKYPLFKLRIESDTLGDEISKNLKLSDSINTFMKFFILASDSCSHLPILKYPNRF